MVKPMNTDPYTTLLTSSSEKNMANLEQIRQKNLGQTGLMEDRGAGEIAIVWLS